MSAEMALLLVRARGALLFSQREAAECMGSALRTVQRFESGASSPMPWHLQRLADAVRPRNPALAAEIDAYAPRPAPPAPPEPPPSPPVSAPLLVDSVVCAAAEAMTVAPQVIRPAILAAFARARDAGLTLEAVIHTLTPPEPPRKPSRAAAEPRP